MKRSQALKKIESSKDDELTKNRRKIGLLLKWFRENAGLTQANIAEKLKYVNTNFVSMVENGKSSPPLGRLDEYRTAYKAPSEIIPVILKHLFPEVWYSVVVTVSENPEIFGTELDRKEIEDAFNAKYEELIKSEIYES